PTLPLFEVFQTRQASHHADSSDWHTQAADAYRNSEHPARLYATTTSRRLCVVPGRKESEQVCACHAFTWIRLPLATLGQHSPTQCPAFSREHELSRQEWHAPLLKCGLEEYR